MLQPLDARQRAAFHDAPVLLIPGLGDSGSDHWQTWWQGQEPAGRVVQDDWSRPDLASWAERVEEALLATGQPCWLVAHSFGCLAAARAGLLHPERVAGALLVAPADPDRFELRSEVPASILPFPCVLVASLNDPWMSCDQVREWAERWGARFVCLGHAGHINADAGFGPWPEGRRLLRDLQAEATRPAR